MFVVLKREGVLFRCLAVLAVIMLLFAVSGEGGAAAVFSGNAGIRKMPIYRVETTEPKIALTFDADMGEDKTEAILEILKQNNLPATFFLAGFWVEKHGNLVTQMDEQGMEIGTHSQTHSHMTKLSQEEQKEEIVASSKKISDLTGKKVEFFRPPYGEYNDSLIDTANLLEKKCILWDIDSRDWEGRTAAEIVTEVVGRAKNGSIVLFHTSANNILQALPVIITALKNKGFGFSTVGNLVYQDNYFIDLTGTQKQKVS